MRSHAALLPALGSALALSACSEPQVPVQELPVDEVSQAAVDDPAETAPEPLSPDLVVERTATIAAPFGAVEIQQIAKPDAVHAEAGHLDITYFDGAGARAAQFDEAVVMGSWGRMSGFYVENGYSDFPIIVAEGGGTWQGYTCVWTSFTELQPDGPVELLVLQTVYSDGGAATDAVTVIEAQTTESTAEGDLTIRFTGSETFEANYRREGDAYKLVSGKEMSGC